MPARERAAIRGNVRGRRILAEIGRELRDARISYGLTQTAVGRSVALSGSRVSLIERGAVPTVPLLRLAELLEVVGLELGARAYPGRSPLRDSAHVALMGRLRQMLPTGTPWQSEVPLPQAGDQRAWDAVIRLGRAVIGIEAETRPRDLQAVLRRIALKQRDGRADLVILLLADTRHNRGLLRDHSGVLTDSFPVGSRAAVQALRNGRAPEASAIVLA